jgi:hypothetical protein
MPSALAHTRKRVTRVALAVTLGLAALTMFASSASASDYKNDIDGVDYALQLIALKQASHISARIGVKLTKLHLAVGWASNPDRVPNGLTGTNEKIDGPGNLDGPICEIAINKHWLEPFSKYEKEEVIAHEVFHCFQKEITPQAKFESGWLEEGLARWVDLTLFPNTHLAVALGSLTEYYETPERSLFDRRYDAVGFWAHVQDVTGELWKRIPAIVKAGVDYHNEAAWKAALGDDESSFLDSWGSSAADVASGPTPGWRPRSPLGGRYWPTLYTPPSISSSTGLAVKPYTTDLVKIDANSAAPLITIGMETPVHGTFGVSEGYVDGAITSKLFCSAASPSECQCPAGYTGTVPATTPLPSDPLLGLASDELGGNVVITYVSPRTSGYCTPEDLTSGRTCEGLLPGFSSEPDATIEKITGQHIALETRSASGYVSYTCPIEYKGTLVEEHFEGTEEEVFRGVLAFLPTVETFPSDAAAQKEFQLHQSAAAAFPESVAMPTPGIGEESFVQSGAVKIERHLEECASEAAVRVHNVVASYGLAGLSPEACGAPAVGLLAAVALEL